MMKKSRKGGMIRNHKEIQEDKGMSYLNQVTGYRGDLLLNRSVVKKGMYALLEPDGLVKNTILPVIRGRSSSAAASGSKSSRAGFPDLETAVLCICGGAGRGLPQ